MAKGPGGRPSKIDTIDLRQVEILAEYGLTDEQIAKAIGIATSTLSDYKNKHPKFLEALKKGKEISDNQVVRSLFERATGYSHEDVHISNYRGEITLTPIIKHYPPDPTAMIFWLKNRDKENWRDKQDHEHSGKDGKPLELKIAPEDADI